MVFIVNLRKILSAYCAYSAGNESCPQPQTSEHLAAIEIMKLKHIIIMQNKIDLVKESQAKEQHDQIVKFVQGMSTFRPDCQVRSRCVHIFSLLRIFHFHSTIPSQPGI